MTNEIIDMTNKLIKPEDVPTSDNDVLKQLSDNLQNITPEDIDDMCEEMNEIKKGDTLTDDNTPKEIEPVENNRFKNIGTIAGMPVEYDECARTVKFGGETFDLNPFEGKLSFMSKVGQYADLFNDENVRKVMFTLNI